MHLEVDEKAQPLLGYQDSYQDGIRELSYDMIFESKNTIYVNNETNFNRFTNLLLSRREFHTNQLVNINLTEFLYISHRKGFILYLNKNDFALCLLYKRCEA